MMWLVMYELYVVICKEYIVINEVYIVIFEVIKFRIDLKDNDI